MENFFLIANEFDYMFCVNSSSYLLFSATDTLIFGMSKKKLNLSQHRLDSHYRLRDIVFLACVQCNSMWSLLEDRFLVLEFSFHFFTLFIYRFLLLLDEFKVHSIEENHLKIIFFKWITAIQCCGLPAEVMRWQKQCGAFYLSH